jgi:hypothetical protein
MSLHSLTKLSSGVAVVAAIALVPLVGGASASAAPAGTRHIQRVGSAAYRPTPVGTGAPAAPSAEIPRAFGPEAQNQQQPGFSVAQAAPGGVASGVVADGIVRNGPRLLSSFDGINHFDQRTTNGGNQFSVEPPDQGLCVGGGHVVEAVNDAFRVFGADGAGQTGVVALNTFFGYAPAIDRTTGIRGPYVTDPSCLFDPTTRTFFLTVLTLETVPATGAFTGQNHLDIAVAADPTGTWNIYRLDVTDNGTNGTPAHPHCPCIGDYPHLGVDANGFYLTTNEYSFFGPEFNSAQIYAFAKRALARGDADVLVTQFDTTGADRGRNGFTIWPAQSPNADQYSRDARGTEFFLSSNAAEEATGTDEHVSDSIVTWSLTNTRSLDSARPEPRLDDTRVGVRTYSLPPAANQKPGPIPLADCLNNDACAPAVLSGSTDAFKPEVESVLDSNDTRMQQVTYANGRLYGALDTAVTVDGAQKAGIGWYIVRPGSRPGGLTAQLSAQGQLGLAGNNLIYPAIGVTAGGRGVMTFTLVGNGYYPSAAYASLDGRTGAGAIFVAKAGAGPQDGFSGYKALGDPPGTTRPRWGDYGASAVDGDTLWIASEYIGQTCTLAQYLASPFGTCGGTRTALANWGTRISQVRP